MDRYLSGPTFRAEAVVVQAIKENDMKLAEIEDRIEYLTKLGKQFMRMRELLNHELKIVTQSRSEEVLQNVAAGVEG